MEPLELSAATKARLDHYEAKIAQAHKQIDTESVNTEIDDFWAYLVQCEHDFFNRTEDTDMASSDMELGFALYFLNYLVSPTLTDILKVSRMPSSKVTNEQAEAGFSLWHVAGDGTLWAPFKYCQLDLGWLAVIPQYFYYRFLSPSSKHDFITTPNVYTPENTENLTIAVIGDWGTGGNNVYQDGNLPNNPAQLVIDGVVSLNPDIIIHLGDVYYAGEAGEEQTNLLDMIPDSYKGQVFTMNSNHEMYNGANGLYDIALGKGSRIDQQNGTTYFAIDLGPDYRIVALDSAFYDKSWLYFKGSLSDGAPGGIDQLNFLREQASKAKNLILMTHHNGIEYDASGVNDLLWNQVFTTLGEHTPDYWYWGHVHNGIVYADMLPKIPGLSRNGNVPKLRCCGHASIPFGNGSGLHQLDGSNEPINEVLYYSHTPLGEDLDQDAHELRVLNGFSMLTFKDGSLSEAFYEVANPNGTPVLKWSS